MSQRRHEEPLEREEPGNGNGHGHEPSRLSDLTDRQLIEQSALASGMAQELSGRAARIGQQAFDKASNAWSAIKGVEREIRLLRASVSSVEVGLLEAIGRLGHETKARGELQAQIDDAKYRANAASIAAERSEITGQHNLAELQRAMRESSQTEAALTEAARASIAVAQAAEALTKQREQRTTDSGDIGRKLGALVVKEKQLELQDQENALTLRAERRRIVIKVAEVAAVSVVTFILTWIFTHH